MTFSKAQHETQLQQIHKQPIKERNNFHEKPPNPLNYKQ